MEFVATNYAFEVPLLECFLASKATLQSLVLIPMIYFMVLAEKGLALFLRKLGRINVRR
jgi:hypothetical protein